MANDRVGVPMLFGGVSTQVPSARHQNQVETADNVYFSVRDAASKRPGAEHIAVVTGLDVNTDYRLHGIDRDEIEKYLVIYGDSTLRIFDLDGVEQTVNLTSAAQSYLDANDAEAGELRLATIADYTLLANTTVALATKTSPAYTLAATMQDADVVQAQLPDMGATPPQEYFYASDDTATYPKGYWRYLVPDEDNGFATWTGAKLRDNWDTTNKYWDNSDKNPMGFKVYFAFKDCGNRLVFWDASAKTLTDATPAGGIFAGYTFTPGDRIFLAGGTGVTAGSYDIAAKVSDRVITLVDSAAIADNADTVISSLGRQYEVSDDFYSNAPRQDDYYEIARRFQERLQAQGAQDAIVQWVEAASIANSYFKIISPYRGEGAVGVYLSAPDAPINSLVGASAPFSGGTSAAGTGTPATDTLAIYSSDSSKPSRWQRVPAPGQRYAMLDETTMPIQIVRTTYGSPSTFDADVVDWTPRLSGNEDTNEPASIFDDGKTVSDLAMHRNRLAIGAGEHIVMSQASDFFNFWIEDAANIGDSDPIDGAVPSASPDRVPTVDFLAPFRKSMVIFTKSGEQAELNAPETLTPVTAAITPSTRYTTISARPALFGTQLYFACSSASGAQVREYAYDDTYNSNVAADVTAHVEGYLPQTIQTLCALPNLNTVCCIEGGTATLYRYRAYWNGADKVQSAWSRLPMNANYSIQDICAVGNDIYMLVKVGTAFNLMRLPAEHPAIPTGMEFMPRLDNWTSVTGVNAGGYTTWTYGYVDSAIDAVVLGADFGDTAGTELLVEQVAGNQAVRIADATGAYAGHAAYVGTRFNMSMELTRPYRRDQNGEAVLDVNMMLHYLVLNHANTATYSVTVSMPDYADITETFVAEDGIEASGQAQFFVRGFADEATVTIHSLSAKPCTLVSGEWIATTQMRAF